LTGEGYLFMRLIEGIWRGPEMSGEQRAQFDR